MGAPTENFIKTTQEIAKTGETSSKVKINKEKRLKLNQGRREMDFKSIQDTKKEMKKIKKITQAALTMIQFQESTSS